MTRSPRSAARPSAHITATTRKLATPIPATGHDRSRHAAPKTGSRGAAHDLRGAPKSGIPSTLTLDGGHGGPGDQVLPAVKKRMDETGTVAGAPGRIKGLVRSFNDIARSLGSRRQALGESAALAGSQLSKPGKLFGGTLGLLGGAGAGLQAATGIKKILRGHRVDGAKDVAAGGLNGMAAATGLSKQAAGPAARGLRALGAAKTFGTAASKVPVAAPIAGAASTLTGSVDAYKGIRDGKAGKAALGGAKALGGGLLVASAFAGPAAPALLAAGGAILLGTTAWDYRKQIGKAAKRVANTIGSGATWAAKKVSGGATWAAHKAGDGAKAVAGGARAVAGGAKSVVDGAGDVLGSVF